MIQGSAKNWKKFGKEDPYYGVLAEERYRTGNITTDGLKDFFATGEQFVVETERRVQQYFDRSIADCSILDFGCGVGRLIIPFSKRTQKNTMGLDVSPDIIQKAEIHKLDQGVPNLQLKSFDGVNLPDLPRFDFINSYIVFQHIESSLGFSLLRQLLETLEKGGIFQVQITYGHELSRLTYYNFYLRAKLPPYNYLYSSWKNKRLGSEPIMQMNHYSPRKLFALFSKYSRSVHVEFTNHGGHLGAFYLLRKDTETKQ